MGSRGEEAQAMSAQPSQPADDGPPAEDEGRPFTSGIGSMVAPAAQDETAPPTRPTFTARSSEPVIVVSEPVVIEPTVSEPVASEPVVSEPAVPGPAAASDDVAARSTVAERPVTPGPAAADLDEPLLGDVAALRGRWQRVQAGFVDDPTEAVGDAADLIEQTAQAMVGALRQRQRQLRVLWERGTADAANGTRADGAEPVAAEPVGRADTEHLRLMMQRYRSLFNQLCPPE
jgi:hypothetical protein